MLFFYFCLSQGILGSLLFLKTKSETVVLFRYFRHSFHMNSMYSINEKQHCAIHVIKQSVNVNEYFCSGIQETEYWHITTDRGAVPVAADLKH